MSEFTHSYPFIEENIFPNYLCGIERFYKLCQNLLFFVREYAIFQIKISKALILTRRYSHFFVLVTCRAVEEILTQQKQLHEGFLHDATDLGSVFIIFVFICIDFSYPPSGVPNTSSLTLDLCEPIVLQRDGPANMFDED